jgi:hypothetical protein
MLDVSAEAGHTAQEGSILSADLDMLVRSSLEEALAFDCGLLWGGALGVAAGCPAKVEGEVRCPCQLWLYSWSGKGGRLRPLASSHATRNVARWAGVIPFRAVIYRAAIGLRAIRGRLLLHWTRKELSASAEGL